MKKSGLLILFIAILTIGIIWMIASRSNHTESSTANAANTPDNEINTTSTCHYPNLEVAEIPSSLKSIRKDYEGFTVSFNPDNGTPNWVGWELLASETDGPYSRTNQFWQDPALKGCPSTDDYKRSGYDRGHLCPAADQKWSEQAMTDCFVLANMAPQDHSLNSGAWASLEKRERAWSERDSAIVIVAGPIYEKSDTKRIGAAGVRVPSAFFKVIAAPYAAKPRAIGFVYPNMSSPGAMQNYVMSVDDVERLTGFDFFSSLPDKIENEIEATTSFKEWNR